jgi:hypothetical protein
MLGPAPVGEILPVERVNYSTRPLSCAVVEPYVWLVDGAVTLRWPATLDDRPDADLDCLVRRGFDWVWFLSV